MNDQVLAKQFTTSSLLRFSLPNIAMMVFLSLYSIVDGMFISRLVGTLALSAINMSYPLSFLELAIGIMLGTGGSAVVATELGEGRQDLARQDFTCIVTTALVSGVAFSVVVGAFLKPILLALGTSPAQYGYCWTYTLILVCFAPMQFLQVVFQVLFVTAGRPGLGLAVTAAGGVTNVVLDYLFMGPMEMGISGAAIATGISYMIPAIAGVLFFFRNRRGELWFVPFRPRWGMLLQTCGNGSSEMVSNIANAITTFLYNSIFLAFWGEDGVASITIAMYFQFVFSAVYFGFSIGVAPVFSYKYGAQDFAQLKQIRRSCVGFILLCSLGMYGLSLLVIETSLAVFTGANNPVYDITIAGFPLYALSFLFMGISVFASALFTALSNGVVSAAISFARTFVFLVGMMLLLPRLLDEPGIWLAVTAAEILGAILSVGFLLWGRKRYQY